MLKTLMPTQRMSSEMEHDDPAMDDGSCFRLLDIGVGMQGREMNLTVETAVPSLPKGKAWMMMRCGGDGHILESNTGDNLAQWLA